jgi:hypothetical protein
LLSAVPRALQVERRRGTNTNVSKLVVRRRLGAYLTERGHVGVACDRWGCGARGFCEQPLGNVVRGDVDDRAVILPIFEADLKVRAVLLQSASKTSYSMLIQARIVVVLSSNSVSADASTSREFGG